MIEEPVVAVRIPPQLRSYTQGRDQVMASGDTVGKVLESVEHEFPGLLSHVVSSAGIVAPALDIWLGSYNIKTLQGLATPVGLEELVSIVPNAQPAN